MAQGTGLAELTLPQALEAQDQQGGPLTIQGVTWGSDPAYDGDAPGDYVFTARLPGGYALQGEAPLPKIAVTVQAGPAQVSPKEAQVTIALDPDEPLYLEEGAAITQADLLRGVTAQDEAGNPVDVSIASTGALDIGDPRLPSDPTEAYIITYEALHPVTGAAFTRERAAYVAAQAVQATPGVTFTFDPEEPLRIEEGAAITQADLLLGVTALDEAGNPVDVSVADTGELNPDDPQRPKGPVFPAIPHLITYRAEHPVTGDVFTRQREAYVTTGIVPAAYAGDFTITLTADGFDPTDGTDYSYDNGVLTIMSSTSMAITNKIPTTPTTHRIVIDEYVTANLTLDGVNISTNTGPALSVPSGAKLNLTLASDNTLKTTDYDSAGLQVPHGAELTITAQNLTGKLTATGGINAAGIGGGRGASGGVIAISGGTVKATGGDGGSSSGGAGIGGGSGGSGGTITISGGAVTADGGDRAAGIGGGGAPPAAQSPSPAAR